MVIVVHSLCAVSWLWVAIPSIRLSFLHSFVIGCGLVARSSCVWNGRILYLRCMYVISYPTTAPHNFLAAVLAFILILLLEYIDVAVYRWQFNYLINLTCVYLNFRGQWCYYATKQTRRIHSKNIQIIAHIIVEYRIIEINYESA